MTDSAVSNRHNAAIGDTIVIQTSDYTGPETLKTIRPILPLNINVQNDPEPGFVRYNIRFGDNQNGFTLLIRTNVLPGKIPGQLVGQHTSIPGISTDFLLPESGGDFSIDFTSGFNPSRYIVVVNLGRALNINKCSYKNDDKYQFNFSTDLLKRPIMWVRFVRLQSVDKDDMCPTIRSLTFNKLKESTIIPLVEIDYQSLIDGSDIGNTIFTITDDVKYYRNKTTPIIPNHICETLTTNNPKTTIFSKSCPLIVNVLKGIGKTAEEKMLYLYNNIDVNNDFYNFYNLLVKYSMLRYILSRIMYGDFNINYVLNNYNKKFLKDLRNTKFCHFVIEFTDPNRDIFGYEQYFL